MSDLPAMPAFIQFHGDDELCFIASQDRLDESSHFGQTPFHPADRLVDAEGHLFSLHRDAEGHLRCARLQGQQSLEEVLQLVRRHAAQDGACCVAKLSAASIAEAIALIE